MVHILLLWQKRFFEVIIGPRNGRLHQRATAILDLIGAIRQSLVVLLALRRRLLRMRMGVGRRYGRRGGIWRRIGGLELIGIRMIGIEEGMGGVLLLMWV